MPTPERGRSRSPARGGPVEGAVVQEATRLLTALFEEAAVQPSHGIAHAVRVLAHVDQGLASPEGAAARARGGRALAVRLAALLHDADDRKLFGTPKGSRPSYPNAERIMQEAGAGQDVAGDALRMIGLVSCSANGNSAPPEASAEPELLWPRWADRLEATGEIGVVRCWQYNCEVQRPESVGTTPRPRTEQQVWELATPERFAEYQRTGGASASMMDHYYDKLLRVARPPPDLVRNSYLEAEMAKQAAPLVRVCLEFGASGAVPLGTIREMAARMELAGG